MSDRATCNDCGHKTRNHGELGCRVMVATNVPLCDCTTPFGAAEKAGCELCAQRRIDRQEMREEAENLAIYESSRKEIEELDRQAEWAPSHEPEQGLFHECTSVREVVFQAVGAGSMCWIDMNGHDQFDDQRASAIGEDAMLAINEFVDGRIKQAVADDRGKTAAIVEEIAAATVVPVDFMGQILAPFTKAATRPHRHNSVAEAPEPSKAAERKAERVAWDKAYAAEREQANVQRASDWRRAMMADARWQSGSRVQE